MTVEVQIIPRDILNKQTDSGRFRINEKRKFKGVGRFVHIYIRRFVMFSPNTRHTYPSSYYSDLRSFSLLSENQIRLSPIFFVFH